MDKVTIPLTRKEWMELTGNVLTECAHSLNIEDKYKKTILNPLLKQVYIKLHNKLHSLKERKNNLILTFPEASALGLSLQENDSLTALVISVTGLIDQKLT